MADNEVKNPRFEDDNVNALRTPDTKKIPCRDCKFRSEDRMNGTIKGATLGMCKKFFVKPQEVIWHGADCEAWESEESLDEE